MQTGPGAEKTMASRPSRIRDRLSPAPRAAVLIVLILLALPARGGGITTIEDHYFGATLFVVETGNTVWPPVPVSSLEEYVGVYGTLADGAPNYGYQAARLFFSNGGQKLYVIDPPGTEVQDFSDALTASSMLGVDLVAIPGAACCSNSPSRHAAIMNALSDHVDGSPNRFGLVDAPLASDAAALLDYRARLSSNHSAVYAPWLVVPGTEPGSSVTVPSTSAVAGVISRIDREMGIFKTPAGTDAVLATTPATALERDLSSHHDTLNPEGVNILREFGSPASLYVWGARTLSNESVQPYVVLARFLRHLEFSMIQSLSWVNSTAPDDVIPAVVETLIEDYLHDYFEIGAFQGISSDEAYFVSCGNELPRLTCVVGVAILKPAEFNLINLAIPYQDAIFRSRFALD